MNDYFLLGRRFLDFLPSPVKLSLLLSTIYIFAGFFRVNLLNVFVMKFINPVFLFARFLVLNRDNSFFGCTGAGIIL